ncbi:hypothetical protein BKA82DRAFT_328900 [Pisolithus tinctorius]|uniref:Uncharacterized protein n=1 Tax=Pisolithus tinctorius Marx 270 TaxID=870435 RepID=A0A0C3PKU3_PISTI|nr:hypothetical protein BKA82DRAFT_328900 [Pisolithus tinctorius]KIO08864.1 hypothetical protein M404DRAFT_328900 [Pisolithus tinctorius Marx 270]
MPSVLFAWVLSVSSYSQIPERRGTLPLMIPNHVIHTYQVSIKHCSIRGHHHQEREFHMFISDTGDYLLPPICSRYSTSYPPSPINSRRLESWHGELLSFV